MSLDTDRRESSASGTVERETSGEPADADARARAVRRAERERHRETGARAPRRRSGRALGKGLLASPPGRVLAATAGLLALLTLVGLAALWPGRLPGGTQQAFGGRTLGAVVTTARTLRCPGPVTQRCRSLVVRVADGPDRGRRAPLDLGPVDATPSLAPGVHVRVQQAGKGAYGFVDVDRRAPMLWLALALVALAGVVARLRGVLALVGVILSVGLVVVFLVPAILAGSDPVAVSLTASLAVMFVTVLLTYGPGPQSLAASVGIGLSLILAALIGHVMVSAAHLDGRTGELQQLLVLGARGVSLQGVVLAGMVIGVLGVLTDMAVSQASAVTALHRADTSLGPRALYRGAFAVGRDHLAATIHTLVLAYVGAALPLVLVLRDAHVGAVDAVNGQIMAEPIVATLVGAIALIAAVPLTTAFAAVLVARMPAASLGAGHAHHPH